MIYIFEGQGHSASIVYDGKYLTEDLRQEGIVVDRLPEAEKNDKQAILKADKSLEKVWWEYEEVKINPVEGTDLDKINKKIELMQSAIDELLIGGIK